MEWDREREHTTEAIFEELMIENLKNVWKVYITHILRSLKNPKKDMKSLTPSKAAEN